MSNNDVYLPILSPNEPQTTISTMSYRGSRRYIRFVRFISYCMDTSLVTLVYAICIIVISQLLLAMLYVFGLREDLFDVGGMVSLLPALAVVACIYFILTIIYIICMIINKLGE